MILVPPDRERSRPHRYRHFGPTIATRISNHFVNRLYFSRRPMWSAIFSRKIGGLASLLVTASFKFSRRLAAKGKEIAEALPSSYACHGSPPPVATGDDMVCAPALAFGPKTRTQFAIIHQHLRSLRRTSLSSIDACGAVALPAEITACPARCRRRPQRYFRWRFRYSPLQINVLSRAAGRRRVTVPCAANHSLRSAMAANQSFLEGRGVPDLRLFNHRQPGLEPAFGVWL